MKGKRTEEWKRLIASTDYIKERFVRKTALQPNGCVRWLGGLTGRGEGYGRFEMRGHVMHAHRASYILNKGAIPEGLVIDHLCRNTWCVNPDHLEAVTNGENVKRGINPAAVNARKTLCSRGHKFINHSGKRICPMCHLQRLRKAAADRGTQGRAHIPSATREQIIALVSNGLSSAAAARRLALNPDTVRNMVRRWRKYGVANRTAVWV